MLSSLIALSSSLTASCRDKAPVHVVVDPVLSRVLRPHQREVSFPLGPGRMAGEIDAFQKAVVPLLELLPTNCDSQTDSSLLQIQSETFVLIILLEV